jgi:hypothetical protein
LALAFRRPAFNTLDDQAALQLRNSPENGEDQLPRWRARVELLGEGNKFNPLGAECLKRSQ